MTRPGYQKGSLKAKGKNSWEIRWREDVMNGDGSIRRIRRKETLQQMSKAQAREVLDEHLGDVKKQRGRPVVITPFSRFVETEWRPKAALELRKSTMRIYDCNLNHHAVPALGEIPVRDLTRAHIEACLAGMQRKGYAVSMLRSVRNAVSKVLEAAIGSRLISENPAHGIRIREADSRPEKRFYRPLELRRLLERLEDPCRAVVQIAVLAGLRIGEILALRWKRVDLLSGVLEVAETYSDGNFGPPKTPSSRRTIPISADLIETLKRLRPLGCDPETLVFATWKGTPLNPKNLYNRQLAPACDAIGQPRVSWHSFRHTHATLLDEIGVSPKTAQALLGHSDLETTLAVYTHAIPEAQRRAVERLAGLLTGVLDPVGPASVVQEIPKGRIN